VSEAKYTVTPGRLETPEERVNHWEPPQPVWEQRSFPCETLHQALTLAGALVEVDGLDVVKIQRHPPAPAPVEEPQP
jgi:hypothetical protein